MCLIPGPVPTLLRTCRGVQTDLEGLCPSPVSHRHRLPHEEGHSPRNVESCCKSQGSTLAGPCSSCVTLSGLCHLLRSTGMAILASAPQFLRKC